MRLLIVGTLNGHISDAIKIAVANGAEVASVDSVKEALTFLRSGKGADLAMVDVALDVVHLLVSMKSERINTCLLYTSPSPRDQRGSRMPSSA